MKRIALAFTLVLGMSACTEIKTNEPTPASTDAAAFKARYAVPLTGGRDNGELEIIDSQMVASVNLAILRPAILQVVKDAFDGKINTYPDEGSTAKADPKTFFKQRMDQHKDYDQTVKENHLCMSLEVDFDGTVERCCNKLTPTALNLIWVDPGYTLPDFMMARVKMEDLKAYSVKRGDKTCDLPSFLKDGIYERYPIHISTPVDTFGVSSFTEAISIQSTIEFGDVLKLKKQESLPN